MVSCRKQLVPMIAATSLLLASGTLANGVSQAEEAVLIPGATVFKRINPLQADQPAVSDCRHDLSGYRDPLSRRCSPAGGRLLAERTCL